MTEPERALWMTLRAALLMAVKAIELYVNVKRPANTNGATLTAKPEFGDSTPTR